MSSESQSLTRWQFIRQVSEDKSGISLVIPISFAIYVFLTGLSGANPAPGGLAPSASDLTSGLTAILIFALASLLRRFTNLRFANITIWVISGSLSVVVAFLVDAVIRRGFASILATGLPMAIVSYSLLVVVLGAIWSGWLGTKAIKKELEKSKKELATRKAQISDELAFVRNQTIADVKTQIQQAIETVSVGASARETSTYLLRVIDEVIRPLSKSLRDVSSEQAVNEARDLPAVTPVKAITSEQLASPALYFLALAAAGFGGALFFFGPLGLILEAVLMALTVTVQLIWLKARASFAGNLISYLAVTISTSLPALIYFFAQSHDQGNFPYVLIMIFDHALVAAALTLFLLVTALRTNSINAAAETNYEMQSIVRRLKQEEWFERERLARIVHGQVQSKLLTASLRLSQSAEPNLADLESVKADLQKALDAVTESVIEAKFNFQNQLEALVATWDGACEISTNITSATVSKLNADRVAGSCVIEIVREAIANAVKHSQATNCRVAVALESPKIISVEVSAPGKLLVTSESQPGFGTQLLRELASSWQIFELNNEVRLHATVELR